MSLLFNPTGFLPMVQELFSKKEHAAILYNDNGVTRANGFITAMFEKNGEHWFTIDGNTDVRVKSLEAVNGVFGSDYTEC